MLLSLCFRFEIDRVTQFTACVIHFLISISDVSLSETLAELNIYMF